MRAREVKRAHQLKRHAQLAILSLEVIGLHLDEIDHSLVRPVEPCARGRGGGPLGERWRRAEGGGGSPMGIWMATAFRWSLARRSSTTLSGSAPSRSSLLMNASRGTLYL